MNSKSENKNNDTKKIATLVILILTVMISTTGATYAYFQISASNTTAMTGTAATVELSLEVTRETPDTTKWNASNKVMVPQLSTALGTAMNATNKCVDGNSNVVCEVFKIVITNGSTSSVRLRGAVFFPGIDSSGTSDTLVFNNLYWRQTTNANTVGNNTIFKTSTSETTNSTTAEAENATLVADLLLAPSASQTYYVAVWIKEINSDQNNTDKGTWTATVSFKDKVNPNKGVTSTITS